MWPVVTGHHQQIPLYFMVPGHTKFGPDWAFGLAKKKLCRSELHCLSDIADAIEASSKVNRAQLCGHENGQVVVYTYDWATFSSPIFKRLSSLFYKASKRMGYSSSRDTIH